MALRRQVAVVGKPIAHSLSPVIHNAGYAAAGLTGWSYTRIECAAAELPDLVAGLGPEWAGLSVTMPGKEAALAVADAASPVAVAVGAANTLVRRPDGSWYADNTDVAGMVQVLTDAGVMAGAAVTVLGAGGTARAALAAAAQLACSSVTVVARRAAAVDELRPVARALGVALTPAGWADAHRYLSAAGVAVSTVPKGVADPLAGAVAWRPGAVFFDALYDPWPTPLAASAVAAGLRVVSGLDLLLAQAVGQFEQFTGVAAPVEAMREALLAARR
ncbi:shikimate dehydrogenase [Micromonospora parathelypteridis]|uniref:Shikimate dehydrogenase n=1 Tax=Micromonospora parathelypteridis TaxID=1839617 RepID=A0A840W5Y4_9ACTN|nr:shikimate dehydrogenase [Micromonospora parathelypteridis]MBB5480488.1 shikimate dehydrogenase [Micromonospora parathelypteridis]GGO23119.1 shikimate 5-dehydrogenase [Micromonospora parathelypteridis]